MYSYESVSSFLLIALMRLPRVASSTLFPYTTLFRSIVIPQFTSASQDARKNSLVSQLQTLRSQLELYKLQHLDQLPTTLISSSPAWTQLTVKSDATGALGTTSAFPFGPYLQADPVNPLNASVAVKVVGADVTPG